MEVNCLDIDHTVAPMKGQHNLVEPCGVVWCGVVWRGVAWRGVAWCGVVCVCGWWGGGEGGRGGGGGFDVELDSTKRGSGPRSDLHLNRAMSLWTWPLKTRHCHQTASAPHGLDSPHQLL